MIKIWKPCHLSNKYEISNFGNVRNSETKKLLTPVKKYKTYQVSLRIENKAKHCKIHRLVCFAFDSDFDNGIVKFKNGNPLDCNYTNLEYNKKIHDINEIWKDYSKNNKYEVSNKGRVRNKMTQRILKTYVNSDGYLNIHINNYTISIHRLIMLEFKSNEYFKGSVINHKNGIKTDNRIENLEWCTIKHNVIHAINNGLNPNFIKYGVNHKSSKLNEEDIPKIRNMYKNIKNYTKVGQKFGISDNAVRKIVQGKTWTHI